jgi:hypothetical protein
MDSWFRQFHDGAAHQVEDVADARSLLWDLFDLVGMLDLTAFAGVYRADGSGGRPYDPWPMVTSIMWCYRHGVRDPGRIAERCATDVRLRTLWGGDQPSAATVRRFLGARFLAAWKTLGIQVLAGCAAAGLVDTAVTATDSSPVAAPAARTANRSTARLRAAARDLDQRLADLDAHIDARLQQLRTDAEAIKAAEEICGRLRIEQQRLVNQRAKVYAALSTATTRQASQGESGQRITKLRGWVEHHQHTLDTITTNQQDKIDRWERGAAHRGRAPVPIDAHAHIRRQRQTLAKARDKLDHALHQDTGRVNLTDPHSRLLKGKNATAWIQGNLLMITVSVGQIILACDLSEAGNDHGELHPSLHTTATNCHQAAITTPFGAHLADGGFASIDTFTTPTPTGGTCYIPTGKPDRHTDPAYQAMHQRMASDHAATLYRQRAGIVEPVFAHLFHPGGRALHTRGPAKHVEITIMAITHNTAKYLHHTPPQHTNRRLVLHPIRC